MKTNCEVIDAIRIKMEFPDNESKYAKLFMKLYNLHVNNSDVILKVKNSNTSRIVMVTLNGSSLDESIKDEWFDIVDSVRIIKLDVIKFAKIEINIESNEEISSISECDDYTFKINKYCDVVKR